MNKDRDDGYYWIKSGGGEWMIAEFYNPERLWVYGHWSLCDTDTSYNDSDFQEIDENRIICPHE